MLEKREGHLRDCEIGSIVGRTDSSLRYRPTKREETS
jgi:hypothetical protein